MLRGLLARLRASRPSSDDAGFPPAPVEGDAVPAGNGREAAEPLDVREPAAPAAASRSESGGEGRDTGSERAAGGPAAAAALSSGPATAADRDHEELAEPEPAKPASRPAGLPGLEQPATRPLPSFRPAAAGTAEPEPRPLEPLALTLSEAIDAVHDGGGDAMELRFLRRELQRRGSEGGEPPELWPRIEQAATGRLRRVGRLAEGQPLALRRDP